MDLPLYAIKPLHWVDKGHILDGNFLVAESIIDQFITYRIYCDNTQKYRLLRIDGDAQMHEIGCDFDSLQFVKQVAFGDWRTCLEGKVLNFNKTQSNKLDDIKNKIYGKFIASDGAIVELVDALPNEEFCVIIIRESIKPGSVAAARLTHFDAKLLFCALANFFSSSEAD